MLRIVATVVLAVLLAVATAAAFPVPARAAPVTTTQAPPPLALTVAALVDGDVVEVTATVSMRGRLPADPVLRVVLPEGAILQEGAREETLARPTDGDDRASETSVVRRFVVRGLGSGRVQLTADAISPASGAHAQTAWPPLQPAALHAAPIPVRIPPVIVGGVRIDQAIPLEPAKRHDP